MRKVLLLAGYLVGMTVLGFFLIPRFVGRQPAKQTATPFAAVVTPLATQTPPPTATATPSATPLPESQYPTAHLVIPSLNVNSAWAPLGYLSDGLTMDSPPGPMDLGWYNFSGQPGGPSNAVFAGHIDWYTGARTIFQGLPSLKDGDDVLVSRADGRLQTYHVVSVTWYDFANTDATPIIAPTDKPTVTLITCGGTFNPATHEYDKRLVVVAQVTA